MIFNPASTSDLDKVSDFLELALQSATSVDRPLTLTDALDGPSSLLERRLAESGSANRRTRSETRRIYQLTQTTTQKEMNNELQREVALRVNRLGTNEYRLALSRAENKNDANQLVELVEAFRLPFSEGRVSSIGSMVAASAETWARIAEEADAAAKRELLKSSAVLTELEELKRKARLAQEEADRKSRELQALWDSYNSLPEQIQTRELKLAQLGNEIRSLDPKQLEENFKSLYRAMLNGVLGSPVSLNDIGMLLYTSGLRVEVLSTKAEELQKEIADLRARLKQVSRKLGR